MHSCTLRQYASHIADPVLPAPVQPLMFPRAAQWDPHFEGKNRMFEMQIQGKLKLLPKGEVRLALLLLLLFW